MVMVEVVVVASGTTTTAGTTHCLNATLNLSRTISESDGCVIGKILHVAETTKLELLVTQIVFCRRKHHCTHPFEWKTFANECVVPNDDKDYLFFGRFLDDKLSEMVLTANPLLFSRKMKKKIEEEYGNASRQSPCQRSSSKHQLP